ncbi:hypothetical protein DFQ26_004318 [Actinomortierella ambigua]|nr:hypothetical protein DFQ26_004318 [Actinomortierella ambigua]
MRVKPLQIHWHDKQPIYSAHFEPGPKGRLATAGGDGNVRIWKVVKDQEKDSTHIEFLSSLNRHTAAVNVVRFSPTAEVIASAGDDGNIILWKPAESKESVSRFDTEDDEDARETWRVQSMMRGSLSDIYDLAWSPCGRYIISGSIDNTARIWDTKDSKCIHVIADHHHYVQGVAWDPLGEYVATQSSDRSVQIYSLKLDKNGNVVVANLGKSTKLDFSKLRGANNAKVEESKAMATTTSNMNGDSGNNEAAEQTTAPAKSGPKSFRLYHDETLTSFFRRLSFTPDGSMLLAPAGQYRAPVQASTTSNTKTDESTGTTPASTTEMETKNTVYIYGRRGLNKGPIAHLPGHRKPSIAVRCNPVLFKLRDIKPPNNQSSVQQDGSRRAPSMFGLDYRALYAVATQDSIMIYDTQQSAALVVVSHLHYATFTDMTWSSDGCTLIMTSSDGFCSIVSFEEGELGQVHHLPVTPPPTIKTEEQLNLAAGLTKQIDGLTVSDKKDKAEKKEKGEKKEKASAEKKEKVAAEKKDKGKGTASDKKGSAKRLFSKVQSTTTTNPTKGSSSSVTASLTFSKPATTFGVRSSSTIPMGASSSSSSSSSPAAAAVSGDVDMVMAPPNEPTKKKRRIQPTFVSALPGSSPSPSPSPASTSASPSTSTTSAPSSTPASPQPLHHPPATVSVTSSVAPGTQPTPPTLGGSGASSQKKRITPIFVRPL